MKVNTFTEIVNIAGRIHNLGRNGTPTPEQMAQARAEILHLLNEDD